MSALDRGDKRKAYAEHRVSHLWYVDPEARTLEVWSLDGPDYRIVDVDSGDAKGRARPFDAVELELGALWAW
jgi:hypothetical protein